MAFVVLPALVTDISAVYDVYFAAFKENAVTRALFPSATPEDMTNAESEFRRAHTAHTQQYWSTDSNQYTLKCVDIKTEQIVGMALWDIYLTPSKWRRGEISWLSGCERERAEQLIWPLWDARERLWLDQKYLYCHVVAVHPEYQRRGIGQMLMEYGIDIAQKVRLPIYIESSRDGMRLYEKIGCRRLKQQPVDKSKTGKPQESNEVEEHDGAVSWVWFPKGGEEILPATVELAPNESC